MKLFLINGTMGAGKTATSQILKSKLNNTVFLDGDWCWDMNPFAVNDRRKQLVMDNIHAMLNNFIASNEYDNIIFCWVMHEESIIDDVLSGLNLNGTEIYKFTLFCNETALRKRLSIDVENGVRSDDVIAKSVQRIPKYMKMNTTKIDVSDITAEQAANEILKSIMLS